MTPGLDSSSADGVAMMRPFIFLYSNEAASKYQYKLKDDICRGFLVIHAQV
jgi:hypothetical protein